MSSNPWHPAVSAFRERMIEEITVRGFSAKTRHDYVRHVRTLSVFVGRSPDTATAEEVRRFHLHQAATGVGAPSINSAVSALCCSRWGTGCWCNDIHAVLKTGAAGLLHRAGSGPF
jgi:hypothetical protein